MKSKYIAWLIICFIAFCADKNLVAQTAAPAPFRFRTLAWDAPVDGLFYDAKGKSIPVTARNYARSNFYEADATNKLDFYRLVPGLDGKPTKQFVGDVSVDGSGGLVLILFFKRSDGSYKINVSEDDTKKFPAGSYRFVNTSSSYLLVAAGNARGTLIPGQSIVLHSDPDQATHGVNIRLATAAGEEIKMVYSDVWLWSADVRTIVYASDTGNQYAPVDLKRISENARLENENIVSPK
jgi:hypothetical protein